MNLEWTERMENGLCRMLEKRIWIAWRMVCEPRWKVQFGFNIDWDYLETEVGIYKIQTIEL